MSLATTTGTLEDLGWAHLLLAVAERAQTPRGSDVAATLGFLDSRSAVESAWAHIEEARQLLRRELPMPLGGVQEVRPVIERACKGAVLEAPELLVCTQVATAASQVRRFTAGLAEDVPRLATVARKLADLMPLASRIDGALQPSGLLRDDASATLAGYRSEARDLHGRLKARIKKSLDDPDFAHRLQDNYFSLRNGRYVVPVQANFRSQVPGIVHNASNSGQTIFVELEELIPLGNELTIAESLAAEEERRVLAELTTEIAEHADSILKNAEVLARLDFLQACARFADDLDCCVPELHDGGAGFELRNARHPLLLLQGKGVVPNTITMGDADWALVISGANAGGKTVTMSTVGLLALMARAGLPLPVSDGSSLPFIEGLSCIIGDAQDLSRDLSTFTAHMKSLGEALRCAGPGWMCLIDEIASDTDPTEGAALAAAALEFLVDTHARVVVTTHLEEVKALGVNDPRFVNARVGMDPDTLRPTFELELGAAGVSKAVDVAAQAGIPAAVIRKARDKLAGGSALSLALTVLEQQQREVAGETRRLAAEVSQIQQERRQLRQELAASERARKEAELEVRRELAAEIDAARLQAAGIIAKLQVRPTIQEAQRANKTLAAGAEAQSSKSARLEAQLEQPVEAGGGPIGAGTLVRHVGLGQKGEVLSIEGQQALVRIGSLKTRAKIDDLVAIGRKPEPQTTRSAPSTAVRNKQQRPSATADSEVPLATCDIRGLRAGEAQRQIAAFLDHNYLHGPACVQFIHGHGTGALRQVVREMLVGSEYVDEFRAGEAHEGGDGVTIVQLRA